MTYPFFILMLLILLYYCLTKVTYEGFTSIRIDNHKNKKKEIQRFKQLKKALTNAEKEYVIVVVPSVDITTDKEIKTMIHEMFIPEKYNCTVVTFTDKNLIKEFLNNLTTQTETPITFPAYFRVDKTLSENTTLVSIRDLPNITDNITTQYKKIKDDVKEKKNMKEKMKDKEKEKKDKKEKDKDKDKDKKDKDKKEKEKEKDKKEKEKQKEKKDKKDKKDKKK